MTFIATVVAQKGAAIIADSLATLMEDIIETDDILSYFEELAEGESIDPEKISALSKRKPNYTKNYAEKLFQYDRYTAITIAGVASVNGKSIEALISEHKLIKGVVPDTSSHDFDDIVNSFVEFLKIQTGEQLKQRKYVDSTIFYVTHYNPTPNVTKVCRINVGFRYEDLENESTEGTVVAYQIPDQQYVICDGQNSKADRILFGDLSAMFKVGYQVIKLVYEDLGQPIPDGYVENFFARHDVLSDDELREGMTILKLNSLSLQQAVNLAALLMRIERDLQSFTENIPTVGGVIKMAVIDKDGFRMIMGDTIEMPSI